MRTLLAKLCSLVGFFFFLYSGMLSAQVTSTRVITSIAVDDPGITITGPQVPFTDPDDSIEGLGNLCLSVEGNVLGEPIQPSFTFPLCRAFPNTTITITFGVTVFHCEAPEVFDLATQSCRPPQFCDGFESVTGNWPFLNGAICNADFTCQLIDTDCQFSDFLNTEKNCIRPPQQSGLCPFSELDYLEDLANEQPPDPENCTTRSECIDQAEEDCSQQGAVGLFDFNFDPDGSFDFVCRFTRDNPPPNSDCPPNIFDEFTQSCQPDSDGDGVADPSDPDPENPDEDGDSDGDGVSDENDDFPDNPDETTDSDGDGVGDNSDNDPFRNGFSNNGGTFTATPVTPRGEISNFDDSRIVEAINQTNELTATGNSISDDIRSNTSESNELLEDILNANRGTGELVGDGNATLEQILDELRNGNSGEDSDGDGTSDVREEGEGLTGDIVDLFGQSSDELGIPVLTDADTDYVRTAFGVFNQNQCVNPTFGQTTLDLCSLSPRVLPVAEFALWLLLIYFIWAETHDVLRRGRGG